MRRLTAKSAIVASAAAAGGLAKESFAFIFAGARPRFPTPEQIQVHFVAGGRLDCLGRGSCRTHSPLQSARAQDQKETHRREEAVEEYGEDDQQRFWDTVVEVLTNELGTGDQLSRVWDFVQHNREGRAPPDELPTSYRATGLYFPGLEAKPWWDRSEFAWLGELEDATTDITREMEALAKAGGGRSFRRGTGEMSTVYDATEGWGTMRIRYMGRFGQPGINYALLPRTLSALRRLPLAPETAAFQRQLPGTGLPLHVDPSNFVLGCHVGVKVPSPADPNSKISGPRASNGGAAVDVAAVQRRSRMANKRGGGGFGFGRGGSTAKRQEKQRVEDGEGDADEVLVGNAQIDPTAQALRVREDYSGGPQQFRGGGGGGGGGGRIGDRAVGESAWIEVSGEKRYWQTGRAFVFDPSFLHRTHNPTPGERVILNIDIWHPGLEEIERTAIRRVCELIEQWNTRSGQFGEE